MNTPTTELYFESHVTIEPVFDRRLDTFKFICMNYGFRVAELLMKKRPDDTPERSQFDTFCTGRSKFYDDLHLRMVNLVKALQENDFQVWRYKIENTLLDVRLK